MTILEKVCCEKKFTNPEKITESFCPSEFGYENVSKKECTQSGINACKFCWNREAEEETEEENFENMLYEYGDIDISDKYKG